MNGQSDLEKFGLDTSVVLRLIVGEPVDQMETAYDFVSALCDSGEPPMISDLTICETYFAAWQHYNVPKPVALEKLCQLLESGKVVPEHDSRVLDVIKISKSSSNKPGFVDRLIHAQYRQASRQLVTFEKASKRLVGTRVLKAAK